MGDLLLNQYMDYVSDLVWKLDDKLGIQSVDQAAARPKPYCFNLLAAGPGLSGILAGYDLFDSVLTREEFHTYHIPFWTLPPHTKRVKITSILHVSMYVSIDCNFCIT